jgi:hypothetical protein
MRRTDPVRALHEIDHPHRVPFAHRHRLRPVFDNRIKFFDRADEAKFIRVRIRQLAIDVDLVPVEAVCCLRIGILRAGVANNVAKTAATWPR